MTPINMDEERVTYANQNFEILKKFYPKRFDLQNDLDVLSDGTDEQAKEAVRKRIDVSYKKINTSQLRERQRRQRPQPRTGIHKTGPEISAIVNDVRPMVGNFSKGTIEITSGLLKVGKICMNAFNAVSRSFGLSPLTSALVTSLALGGNHLYNDHKYNQQRDLIDKFSNASIEQDANTRLFNQTALEGFKGGASPIIMTMIMAAETGFYDLDGMRNDRGADFYQGPLQLSPAALIELVRHHAKDSEFYMNADENDSRKIAIDAFFEDGRYTTQEGRVDLVRDMVDGTNNFTWRTFLNLRNDPIIGQLSGADLCDKFPETCMDNLSPNINDHYKESIAIAADVYLSHLAGPTGVNRINAVIETDPNIRFSQTETITNILDNNDAANALLTMANANATTVFLDGEDTKFGDITRYTQQFIVNRGEQYYKELLISMGADEDIFITNQLLIITAPATSIRPIARPETAQAKNEHAMRPIARPLQRTPNSG